MLKPYLGPLYGVFYIPLNLHLVSVLFSTSHGNVLVLDDCVQCSDRDEFTYQEMIAYLPLFAHPNPKKVWFCGLHAMAFCLGEIIFIS